MTASVRWSPAQQQCLAAMGLRQWRLRPASSAEQPTRLASVDAPSAEHNDLAAMAWLSAASHDQPARLALVWSQHDAQAVETLLRDLARHLGAALPGQPQPVGAWPAAHRLLVFGELASAPAQAIQLPALSTLLSGELSPRREAWQTLRRVIMEQAAP